MKDIRHCMMVNYLLLNPGKTEVIIVGSRNQRDTLSDQIVALDCVSVASSSTVRNLGVIFVQDLSFKAQIIKLVKLPFFSSVQHQPRLGISYLKVMLKNSFMHLLHQG